MKRVLTIVIVILVTFLVVACTTEKTNTATVTFDSKGGTLVESKVVEKGSLVDEPTAPTLEGHDFNGWYKDEEFSSKWLFDVHTVIEDITLFALFTPEKEPYKVTFDSNGGTLVPEVQTLGLDLLPVPQQPVLEGKIFGGWYKDADFTKLFDFSNDLVEEDLTLYAKWKEKTDFNKSLKILSIGNSFSEDAHRFLWEIANSYGIENVVIANMYIGGAELRQHSANVNANAQVYEYQLYKSGSISRQTNKSISDVIGLENWDVITFQQASHFSGVEKEYKNYIANLVSWVETFATNPNVQLQWHMTWAYQQTSNHSGFANYDKSQEKMYEMIVDTVFSKVLPITQLNNVIPSGTAIQNARTSYKGDLFTRDGYHLSDPLGRYIAGLMYFKSITGFTLDKNTVTYKPQGVSEYDQELAMEAVNNAFTKPYEVTNSTYTEEPEVEPIAVNGVSYPFTYVQGFWNNNATSISPETDGLHKNFVGVMPIAKGFLPVGSEIVIDPGYQYRVVFLEKTDTGFKVVHRGENTSNQYVVIDEAFWSNYQYVAFNVSSVPTGDISQRLDEVASKLKLYHPEGTLDSHMDTEITYVSGTWDIDLNDVVENNISFSTNPLTPGFYGVDQFVFVSEGYEFAYVVFEFSAGKYTITYVSDYQTSQLFMNEEFVNNKQLIGFTVRKVDLTEITDEIESILTIQPARVEHVNNPLSFVSGYWADNATSVFNTDAFSKKFIASNILSKSYYLGAQSLTIEEGYQVRVIYFEYDGFGNYKVLKRTANFTGVVVMDEAFWADYKFVGFNLSKVGNNVDINEEIELTASKLTFQLTPLTFKLGYWNTNQTELTTNQNNSKNFIGSNIYGVGALPVGTVLKIAEGYQVRVIALQETETGFKVVSRTENIKGDQVLLSAYLKGNDFVAFNLSPVLSTDLTNIVAETSLKLTFAKFNDEIIEHIDVTLTYQSGYWNDNSYTVFNTDNFSKNFVASNVLSKESLANMGSFIVSEGYQVRVVFLVYEYNTYFVVNRTANFTGTIIMDEAFWKDYEYIAFNISKVGNSVSLENEIELTGEQLAFNALV